MHIAPQLFFRRSLLIAFALLLALTGAAQAITTSALQAIVLDAETGTVLFEKSADEHMAPSSMTKIMTALIVFDKLNEGTIDLDTRFKVSRKAWAKGGSKMFLHERTFVRVRDLLRGLIVQSGNDAAITLAEGIAGTEADFAMLMNQRAASIGMTTTNFVNASGWPDDNHFSTARDIAALSTYLVLNYTKYYGFFGEGSFKYKGVNQRNRNLLLGKPGLGVDGIKTGATKAGGYGISLSAVKDGRRIIVVLNGMKSKRERTTEGERMVDWALRNFDNYTLFTGGQVVDYAHVWLGEKKRVPLVVKDSFRTTMSRSARANLEARLIYNGPIPAPVTKGQRVGDIILAAPGITPIRLELIAGEEVPKLGRLGAVLTGLRHTVLGSDLTW